MTTESNLRDIGDVPASDVWGDTVQARVIVGNNASLAVVELGPEAIVPEHRHEHEQLGLVERRSSQQQSDLIDGACVNQNWRPTFHSAKIDPS